MNISKRESLSKLRLGVGSGKQKEKHEVDGDSDAPVQAPNDSYVSGEIVDGISDVPITVICYSSVNQNAPADLSLQIHGLPSDEQVSLKTSGETNLSPVAKSILKKELEDCPHEKISVSFSNGSPDDKLECTDVISPVTSRRAPGVFSSVKNKTTVTPDRRPDDNVLLSPVSSGLVSRYRNHYETSTTESVKKESFLTPSSEASRGAVPKPLRDDSSPFNRNLQFLKENLHFTNSTGALAAPPDAFRRDATPRKGKRLIEKKGFLTQGVRQMLGKISSASSSENVTSPVNSLTCSEKSKATRSEKRFKIRNRSSNNGGASADDVGYSTVEEDNVEKLPKGRINYGAVPDDCGDTKKAGDVSKSPAHPYATRDIIQDLVDLELLADLRSYDFVHRNLSKRSHSTASRQGTRAAVNAGGATASMLYPQVGGGISPCMLLRSTLSDPPSLISLAGSTHSCRASFTSATSEEHYSEIHAALQGIIKTEGSKGQPAVDLPQRPPAGFVASPTVAVLGAYIRSNNGSESSRRVNSYSSHSITGGPAGGNVWRNRPNSAGIYADYASNIRPRDVLSGIGCETESSESASSSVPEAERRLFSWPKRSEGSSSEARNTRSRNFDKNVYACIAAGQPSDEKGTKQLSLLERISSFASRRGKDKENGTSAKKKSSMKTCVLSHRGSQLGSIGRGGWGKDTLMAHTDATLSYLAEFTPIVIRRPGNQSHMGGSKILQSFGWNRNSDNYSSPVAEQSFPKQRKKDLCFSRAASSEKIDEPRLLFTTFGFSSSSKNALPPPVILCPNMQITKQPLNDMSSVFVKNDLNAIQINPECIYMKPKMNTFTVHSPDAPVTDLRPSRSDINRSNWVDTGDKWGSRRGSDSDLGEDDVFYNSYGGRASSNYSVSPSALRSPMTSFGLDGGATLTEICGNASPLASSGGFERPGYARPLLLLAGSDKVNNGLWPVSGSGDRKPSERIPLERRTVTSDFSSSREDLVDTGSIVEGIGIARL